MCMIKTEKTHKGYLKKELREMEQLKNPPVEAHKRAVHEGDDLVRSSSSSGISSGSSVESDSFEEITSNSSSSSSDHLAAHDSLSDMSSLFQQLPIKRGLSRHYEGKSRSFTSLASVRSLEDLAKPENPHKKILKSCRRSYGGLLCSPNAFSRQICKRRWDSSSRGSCSNSHSSSLSAKRKSVNFMARRPPSPPHRSTTAVSNQTALFA